MLWGQRDQEHVQVLVQRAKRQRELHHSASFEAETELYREWLGKASLQGHTGPVQAFLEPFQSLPRKERMEARVQQWTAIWGKESSHQVKSLPAMIVKAKAKEHARQMQPINEKQVWKTIKQLSNKAPGLDGIGFDFLKALPYAATKDIVRAGHSSQSMVGCTGGTTAEIEGDRETHSACGDDVQAVVQTPEQLHQKSDRRRIPLGEGYSGHRMPAGCFEEGLCHGTQPGHAEDCNLSAVGHVQFL